MGAEFQSVVMSTSFLFSRTDGLVVYFWLSQATAMKRQYEVVQFPVKFVCT